MQLKILSTLQKRHISNVPKVLALPCLSLRLSYTVIIRIRYVLSSSTTLLQPINPPIDSDKVIQKHGPTQPNETSPTNRPKVETDSNSNSPIGKRQSRSNTNPKCKQVCMHTYPSQQYAKTLPRTCIEPCICHRDSGRTEVSTDGSGYNSSA